MNVQKIRNYWEQLYKKFLDEIHDTTEYKKHGFTRRYVWVRIMHEILFTYSDVDIEYIYKRLIDPETINVNLEESLEEKIILTYVAMEQYTRHRNRGLFI